MKVVSANSLDFFFFFFGKSRELSKQQGQLGRIQYSSHLGSAAEE